MEATPEAQIRARIAESGKITFAEFTELALYHPTGGYYSRRGAEGTAADFFTSPMAHPVFGALMAIQARRMWELLGRPSPFFMVEMGAGAGLLARDILDFAPSLEAAFGESLRYVALERYAVRPPSGESRAGPDRVVTSLVPLNDVVGCFISNELVDSFPVHRFEIQNGSIRELFVTIDGGDFAEVSGDPSTPLLERRLQRLGFPLKDGYRGEVNLELGPWLNGVSAALRRGFVVTIDYGYEAAELYSPRRRMGTVQTYYRHTDGGSPYRRVGRQDISAHVDFSQIMSEGDAVGLRTVALLSQGQYMRCLGFDTLMARLRRMPMSQRNLSANRMAMLELVKEDGLGGLKVLVQEKGTGLRELPVLISGASDVAGSAREAPLLRSHHMRLMEARYPHAAWDPGDMWPSP